MKRALALILCAALLLPLVTAYGGEYNAGFAITSAMTVTDIYALARKGEELALQDFEPFAYQPNSLDLPWRRYYVEGAGDVTVHEKNGVLESALFMSCRTLDPAKVIDLRDGLPAVAAYMSPRHSFMDITIEYTHDGQEVDELYYKDTLGLYRYYFNVNTKRVNSFFVVFDDGERMPLFEALDEGRITIEDAVTDEYAGIYRLTNMRMVPADNPLGGDFVALHHIFQFSLNREAFYPSKSFLYYDWHKASMYFDMDELVQILEWYGYADKAAELRQSIGRDEFMTIAGKKYLHSDALAKVGIETDMILYLSSCTPVRLTIK